MNGIQAPCRKVPEKSHGRQELFLRIFLLPESKRAFRFFVLVDIHNDMRRKNEREVPLGFEEDALSPRE